MSSGWDAHTKDGIERGKQLEIEMQARTPTIARLVQDCADNKIGFDELCTRVAAMGYKTTSLYEMVCAAKPAR